jgi:hypothetical protein
MDKIMPIVNIVCGVIVGLPALLHAIRAFLKLIPGDPGDAAVGYLEDKSQMIASFIVKVFPGGAQPPQA